MIPIGGHFVLDPQDAGFVTREWLRPKYAIPIHYGTTPLMKGTPEEYRAALAGSAVAMIPMQPGEKVEF